MREASDFGGRAELLEQALSRCLPSGLVMEFGVYKGASLKLIADRLTGPVQGFDSFEGLPEDWTGPQKKGRFSLGGELPGGLPMSVQLHKGWFSDTLPAFLAANPGAVRFAHIDCDLYSSARTVLDLLASRLVDGSILVFDEYFNYAGWQRHEHRALQEASAKHGFSFRYIGYASAWGSVGIRVGA